METNSKRKYEVTIVENGIMTVKGVKVGAILTNNDNDPDDEGYEFEYALQGIVDDVLDLEQGDSMYFQPNRDNGDSKGIILRV